jgi:uncharacterized protein
LTNRFPSTVDSLAIRAIGLLAFLGLVGCVAVIALKGQQLTWSDVGCGHVAWTSFVWAAGLARFFVFVFGPLAHASLVGLGVGSFNTGPAKISSLPMWYLVLTVFVVAAGGEWLYRGCAIERLDVITGDAWIAGAISLTAFVLAHVPMWGLWPSLTTVFSGGILTALYIWRRDIRLLILTHVATDLCGIVIAPLIVARP